ncbi:MAG: c-type cytochrome [Vicinamibacteria bacterium]
MRTITGTIAVLTVASAAVWASAQTPTKGAPDELDGPALYKTYCSSCHGASGEGDGPIADALRYRPADLTKLAQRAKGSFARDKVHQMIDGRVPVKGHGGPDMPLWGDAFKRSGDGYGDAGVRERIAAIVDHLESIQVR